MTDKLSGYWFQYNLKCWIYLPVTFFKRFLLGRNEYAKSYFCNKWALFSAETAGRLKKNPSIWVVANSGGEVIQSLVLLNKIKGLYPQYPLVVSTESYDTFKYLRKQKAVDLVFFTPWDIPLVSRKVLNVIKPKALVFIEHCYYPVLAREAKNKGVGVLMFSAKIQPGFLRENYLLKRSFGLRFYDHMDYIGVKTDADKKNICALGVSEKIVEVAGDLRLDLGHLMLSEEDKSRIRRESAIRDNERVFLVGSVHKDEAGLILDSFDRLRKGNKPLKLIIAPRWDKDILFMQDEIMKMGYTYSLRSRDSGKTKDYDVLILDTFGELPFFYGIADVAFISSSIIPINSRRLGHNIFEPLAHGVPTLFGPHMNAWREATEHLKQVWPKCEVNDPLSLADSISGIISDSVICSRLKQAAFKLSSSKSNIVSSYLGKLKSFTG